MTPPSEPFPWRSVLHTGLCLLRLPPQTFWALSPIEFAAMAGQFAPDADYPTRGTLAALMARYPDAERMPDHGD